MTSKSMKPQGAPKPLTKEERAAQIARFLSQKREQYITSILFGLVHNPNLGLTPEQAVKWAVSAGDALMDALYPVKTEQAPENE